MKRLLLTALMLALLCSASRGEEIRYLDGVYRGFYYSDAKEQVAVQFELLDGRFESVVLRSLNNRFGSLLDEEANENQREKLAHFSTLCRYLEGKEVAAINDLYDAETILLDAGIVPSAGIPYEKLISALWDGISHHPFKLVNTSKLPAAKPYPDGAYTGIYSDDDGEQVVLDFIIQNNAVVSISYTMLAYKGEDYLSEDASDMAKEIAMQFQQLIDYLVGKDLSAVNDLYIPANIAQDTDIFSAATLRAPKIISAIWEGLNKNVYTVK